jgi:predicted permease
MPAGFRRVFRITRHQRDAARDVRDELRFHIEMRAKELAEAGLSTEGALREAEAAFGDRRSYESECRELTATRQRRADLRSQLAALARDLHYSLRALAARPAYTGIAVLTFAVGIGAHTALFAVVRSVLIRPLPFVEPERLALLYNSYPRAGVPRSGNSIGDHDDRREHVPAIAEAGLYQQISATLGETGSTRNAFSMPVTPSFFSTLGVKPALGRTFREDEGWPGHAPVVVISHGLWNAHFGRGEAAVGKTLRLNGTPHTVIGVMPETFRFPTWDAELWLPLAFSEAQRSNRAQQPSDFQMIARLAPGVSIEEAQSQLDALDAALLEAAPPEIARQAEQAGYRSRVVGFQDDLLKDVRAPLYLLWGAVAFILLIGCLNVATLILVRTTARLREVATRYVLGAGRSQIVRQQLAESAILALVGGVLGVLWGAWAMGLVGVFEEYQVPRIDEVRIDAGVVGFVALLVAASSLVAGLLPALAASRIDIGAALRSGGSTATPGPGITRLRKLLVASQLAVAFVLLAGAGLMLASVRNAFAVDPGFEPRGVVAAGVVVTPERYPASERRLRFIDDFLERLQATAGIVGAATASQLPFSGSETSTAVRPVGDDRAAGDSVDGHLVTSVSPGYFDVMRIPLLDGRGFSERDDGESAPVAVVDDGLARRYWHWPEVSPVGEQISIGSQRPQRATVVGVVGGVVHKDLTEPDPRGAVYLPQRQTGVAFTRIAVRGVAGREATLAATREALAAVDPDVPLIWTHTMEESIGFTLMNRRIPLLFLAAFAIVALLLAAMGLYGALAYSVAQRSREVSIRLALGSTRGRIYALVLGQALAVAVPGLVVGLGAALVLSRWLRSFLFRIGPSDPGVLAAVAAVLALAALAASVLPTWRALRIGVAPALRAE